MFNDILFGILKCFDQKEDLCELSDQETSI